MGTFGICAAVVAAWLAAALAARWVVPVALEGRALRAAFAVAAWAFAALHAAAVAVPADLLTAAGLPRLVGSAGPVTAGALVAFALLAFPVTAIAESSGWLDSRSGRSGFPAVVFAATAAAGAAVVALNMRPAPHSDGLQYSYLAATAELVAVFLMSKLMLVRVQA